MTANEFIQNVYKGQSLHECEEHLKTFCKEKLQDMIPEHFEQTKKYTEIAKAHKALFEKCKDSNCSDSDEDSEDSEDSDEEDEE